MGLYSPIYLGLSQSMNWEIRFYPAKQHVNQLSTINHPLFIPIKDPINPWPMRPMPSPGTFWRLPESPRAGPHRRHPIRRLRFVWHLHQPAQNLDAAGGVPKFRGGEDF